MFSFFATVFLNYTTRLGFRSAGENVLPSGIYEKLTELSRWICKTNSAQTNVLVRENRIENRQRRVVVVTTTRWTRPFRNPPGKCPRAHSTVCVCIYIIYIIKKMSLRVTFTPKFKFLHGFLFLCILYTGGKIEWHLKEKPRNEERTPIDETTLILITLSFERGAIPGHFHLRLWIIFVRAPYT